MSTNRQVDTSTAIKRESSPYLDSILGHSFPVLDHGFVRCISYMGNDEAIVQAARVSYGTGTKKDSPNEGLIRYLMRHHHSTPFEMCLSGDTRVPHFSPDGVTVKTYTMKELADAFEQGGRENSWVKLLKIRTVNPKTGVVTATKIKRAWKTGTQAVYEIVTKAPFVRRLKVTSNHRIMTPNGFNTIDDGLTSGSSVMLNGLPATADDIIAEIVDRRAKGQSLKTVAEALNVSKSLVYKYAPGRAKRKTGYLRVEAGNHVDPRAIARRVKELTTCEALSCQEMADHVHHVDENPHNNDLSNLMGLCTKHHKHAHHISRLEVAVEGEIDTITYIGIEDVYDLETEDDNHTFVAEGIVVHNCSLKLHVKLPVFVARQWVRHRTAHINEYSARYSILDREFYIPSPEDIHAQSATNNQGRGEALKSAQAIHAHRLLDQASEEAYGDYEHLHQTGEYTDKQGAKLAGLGVAREIARIVLPTNIYTQWYWKIDLHNLFHFLRLRADSHAQYEIRVYADVIFDMVRHWVPLAAKAFEDYRMNAKTFSAQEMELIRDLLENSENPRTDTGLSDREYKEFLQKIKG